MFLSLIWPDLEKMNYKPGLEDISWTAGLSFFDSRDLFVFCWETCGDQIPKASFYWKTHKESLWSLLWLAVLNFAPCVYKPQLIKGENITF